MGEVAVEEGGAMGKEETAQVSGSLLLLRHHRGVHKTGPEGLKALRDAEARAGRKGGGGGGGIVTARLCKGGREGGREGRKEGGREGGREGHNGSAY
jgi:hypothetical protein